MDNPFISIIVATYNRAWCIERAINSVLCQTYKNFELIVVDDGSRDKTYEKAKNAGADVLKHIVNLGKGAATNTIQIAEYLIDNKLV